MKSIKCLNCGLVSFETQTICKRCGVSFTDNSSESNFNNSKKTQKPAYSTNQHSVFVREDEEIKSAAWKKIKLGLIISIIGFAVTSAAIYLGVFQGYENTERTYLNLAKIFSLITILPLSFVLAGSVELITGISIFEIIEKWEEMPQWLGWTIGISVFLLVITIIMVVAAVIIFNFF